MTDLVGQTLFDRYHLTRLLEHEANANVYLAQDSSLLRPIVLKVWDALPEESMRSTFWSHIRPLMRLKHPHIHSVYDFGIQDQRPFIVQRYVSQGSLRQRHPPGSKLPIRLVVRYVKQIADALQYAHDQNIVHSNLKPENILMEEFDDRLLLTGFRIMTPANTAVSREVTAQAEADPYMAPELTTDEPQPTSDQYALAAMVYEWLYGTPPSQHVAQQGRHAQRDDDNNLLNSDESESALPQVLKHVVMKALARDAAQRFGSIQEFANTLEAASEGNGGPPTTSVRVFFSYAQRDQSLCDQLENHLSILKYRGLITTWSARKIRAGEDTRQQIDISLSTAHVILLLISANFLASEYCYSQEMLRAIRRHERGEVHVIPVLLRPVLITDAPFANLKPLPSNQKPVVSWRNRDSAFVDIAIGIERIAKQRLGAISPYSYPHPATPSSPGGEDWDSYSTTPFSPEEEDWDSYPSSSSTPTRSWEVRGPGLPRPKPVTPSIPTRIGKAALTCLLWLWPPFLLRKWQRHRQEQERAERYRREQALLKEQEQQRRRALALLREQYAQRQREQEESHRRLIEASGLSVYEYEYYEQALKAYEQALAEDRFDADAYRGKGHALAALQQYNEALQAFEKSQRLKPLSSTYVSIGNVLATMERWNEAVAAYQQALALDASSASAYASLSAALTHLGRTQEAQEASEQARQLDLED